MIKGQFAKNLHKAVSERGIKQVELAKVLEVPPTTVNGWMRGAHLPDIEKLMEICDYLEMPVGEMLGDHRHINDLDEVKHLMDVSLKQKAYYFKVLSNRIRRNILLLLEEESLCAGDIIKHFDLTGATISYHLKVLTKSKILVRKKQGLTVYYSLNQPEWEYIKNWFKCG